MANVLIVHAHPEPKSYSGALARVAAEAFTKAGHSVTFSNLCEMSFDPVSSRRNFLTVADAGYLKPQAEEKYATAHNGFSPVVESEIRKLEACDLLIFSFPLWWFGLPAALKGWVDRVFAYDRVYGNGRWYETGIGRGKRAMVLMTTGSPATAYRSGGLHASLESILEPIHHGIFWFNGFSVLPPFVTWGPARISAEARAEELLKLRKRLLTAFDERVIAMAPASEYLPDSWVDQISHVLVTARPRAEFTRGAIGLTSVDREALRELQRSGILLRAMIAEAGAESWTAAFEFRTKDIAAVLAQLKAQPLGALCEFTSTQIDLTEEDALSPIWTLEETKPNEKTPAV